MRSRFDGLGVWIILVMAGFMVAAPVAWSAPATALEVGLENGRLSVHVVDVPVAAVVAEIGRLSGASVTGLDGEDLAVTASFIDLSLNEGLERLLQGRSYFLGYANGSGELRRIEVLGGRTPETRRASAPVVVAPEAATPDAGDADLAEAVHVLTGALHSDDADLRLRVLQDVLTWSVHNPSRAIVLARLTGDPDPEIREVVLDVIRSGQGPRS